MGPKLQMLRTLGRNIWWRERGFSGWANMLLKRGFAANPLIKKEDDNTTIRNDYYTKQECNKLNGDVMRSPYTAASVGVGVGVWEGRGGCLSWLVASFCLFFLSFLPSLPSFLPSTLLSLFLHFLRLILIFPSISNPTSFFSISDLFSRPFLRSFFPSPFFLPKQCNNPS